jgi:hypothetical protein
MSDRLDPTFVRMQIEQLRLTHPGIWEDGDEQLLLDSLEGETDFHRFMTAVVRRMCEAEACADGIGDLIREVKERQQRFEQRSDAMRSLAFKVMNIAAVRKVELPQATLSIRAGTPKVIVTDEAALPENCIRIKREPDKIAIKEHLARGDQVPGAEMSNAEPVLAMRIK